MSLFGCKNQYFVNHIREVYFYQMRLLTVLYALILMFSILEVDAGGIVQTFHDEYDYYLLSDNPGQWVNPQVGGNESPLSFVTFQSIRISSFFCYSPHKPSATNEQTQFSFSRLYIQNCTFLI